MSSTSVKLTWDRPARDLRNGDIVQYEVMYYKLTDHIDTFDANTTEKFMIIEGLDMNTDYVFQIKGYTTKGAGPWSNKLKFRSFGQCKNFCS